MVTKRVIQTYKAPNQWVNGPPGLGDFVRGACHLVEKLQGSGIELRIDVSQTEFFGLIQQDPKIFQSGDPIRIATAEEYFVDHVALHTRLVEFLHSNESELYVCTNLGAWNRLTLPEYVRDFIRGFYLFNETVQRLNQQALSTNNYEVVSVRCGDQFYSNPNSTPHLAVKSRIDSLLEEFIIPHAANPIVITSDCHELKCDLSRRYGMLMLPHRSQHGAFGNALPVAMDMSLLKNSRFNYHINSWATWWSGFSHYTSLLFDIPSMNFRAPDFVKEEITGAGELLL